jgi:carboxypeptidase Q
MRKTIVFFLFIGYSISLLAQTDAPDAEATAKIRNEGMNNSKVMDIAFHLTDVSGPRLTNSEGYFRAANYAKAKLAEWGLKDAKLDPWGEFGKGWELEKSYVALTAPYYRTLIAYPKAWCAGTKGLQSAEIIVVDAKDSAGLEAYKGKLKGKVIIIDRNDVYKHSFRADASRITDERLDSMSKAVAQQGGRRGPNTGDTAQQRRLREQFQRGGGAARVVAILKEMAKKEGAVAVLSVGAKNHDGTLFTQGGGGYKPADPENFLDIMLGIEDYNSILRLAKAKIPVKLDVDVKTKFNTKDAQGYNVIAEIPGTDPTLKNEVVMIGAHLDSWHTATGATDNAAGSAVMMEVIRIIKTLGLNNKRTIRIGLWSGEEEGLLGSRGYVKKTFADPSTMQLTAAHEKFSSYFNIDNGTGKIRGIYLQGNEACRNIFAAWLMPFKDMGATTVTASNTGGTDHQAFDAVGLPGFQFIQDPIEYDQRTHHSNMDSYDHLIEDDLKQMATIVASFVYNAATRSEKIPRKPLPQAQQGGRGF